MTKLYTYLTLAGIVSIGLPALASGLPTYGFAEIVTMKVDSLKNVATQDILQTHKNLVRGALRGVKGGYGAQELLSGGSSVVTGRSEGLQTLLGEGDSLMTCGEGAKDSLVSLLTDRNRGVVSPATEKDRLELTTANDEARQKRLEKAIEMASTTALAKAWLAQAEAATVSETLSSLQEKLADNATQMDVLTTILLLQEETQKNINVRLSIMGDELVNAGLSALNTGL